MSRMEERINPGLLGIKPYVPGKSVREARRELAELAFTKMASNENPLGVSPKALQAVLEALRESYQYPESTSRELRLALAGRLGVGPENILVGNGADGILYTLGITLLNEGDEAIIPECTFALYEIVTRFMRARPVFSAMRRYGIDLEDIRRRITSRTKLIFLCNPNNPTGTLLPREEVLPFLEEVPDSIFVVYDEVYADFAAAELFPSGIELVRRGRSNLLVARSFSKLYGLAGIRVGYGVAAEELIRLMARVHQPFEVSLLAQAAALAALEDAEFCRRTLELTRRGKDFFYRRLKALGLGFVESHTNFILIDTGRDSGQVFAELLREGIIVRAGYGGPLARFIRVTIGTEEQNRRVLEALEGIATRKAGP